MFKSKRIKSSFRFKVLSIIIGVAFVCISVVSVVSYFKSRQALEAQSINQFSSMGETMKFRLSEFDKNSRIFSQRLGKNRLIEGMFLAYEGAFYGAGLFPGEDLNINTNQYMKLEEAYGERTTSLTKDFYLQNIFLTSLDAQILKTSVSDKNNAFLGRNLLNGIYKGSKLSKCFSQALADTEGTIYFSEFEYNKVTKNVNAFYCVKQLAEFDHLSEGIKKGDVMGIVITQVDVLGLSNIVSQRVGMGETGQAYLVGHDKKLRTDFYVNKKKFNTINAFKSNEEIKSLSVDLSLKGDTGTHFIVDPNGKNVLSYYAPIEMFGYSWAIIAEIQESELFAPVKSMIIFVSILAFFALIIITLIGIFVTNKLIFPIISANEVLGEVASEVTENAGKMKTNSEDLSDSSNQIASAIQETVSTLDELSSMVSKNLENVELSGMKSEESKEVAQQGKASVTSMISAMGEINSSNEEIVNEMNNISAKMNEIINVINEIGEKTNIINDIVFQTKLLSFNASVEAARAGEHGKGFAVVAEEVGSLATASGTAATEIGEMLGDSLKTVDSIVKETRAKIGTLSTLGQEKVEVGTKTAKECESVLDKILTNVLEVNDKVSEISNASNEQAIGIKEVAKAMSQLDEMTHNTSNISTDALRSSEVLNVESERLSNVVNDLSELVSGESRENLDENVVPIDSKNVDKIELSKSTVETEKELPYKKVVGSNLDVPSSDDDRFDDV